MTAKILKFTNSSRKIKALKKQVDELDQIASAVKLSIKSLTTYIEYSNIRNRVNDLFMLYKEISTMREKKIQLLTRLENEKDLD